MRFLTEYGKDILGGICVMAVFLLVKHWSFDKEPKYRANGVPYNSQRAALGDENDWQSTIVDGKS